MTRHALYRFEDAEILAFTNTLENITELHTAVGQMTLAYPHLPEVVFSISQGLDALTASYLDDRGVVQDSMMAIVRNGSIKVFNGVTQPPPLRLAHPAT